MLSLRLNSDCVLRRRGTCRNRRVFAELDVNHQISMTRARGSKLCSINFARTLLVMMRAISGFVPYIQRNPPGECWKKKTDQNWRSVNWCMFPMSSDKIGFDFSSKVVNCEIYCFLSFWMRIIGCCIPIYFSSKFNKVFFYLEGLEFLFENLILFAFAEVYLKYCSLWQS